jgi:hypothetical protein
MLSDNLLELPAGESENVTLTVTIPENAEPGAEDSIIVTATSQENEDISDNDSCIAHATAPRAELSLVTLYEVELDLDVYLENGSKLVVKFYKYGGTVLQAENVVWENVTPARITLLENVSHPQRAEGFPNGTVQIARLVLTTDNTEEVISTLASLTVYQSDLRDRYIEILIDWASYPEKQPAFRAEIINILLQWASAPP